MQKATRKAVILILLVSLALLVTVPQALAATGYKIEGNANGLTIESQPNEQGTGNLNPGDEKASRLKLTNTNDDDVRVWIRTNITERRIPEGSRDLSEVLHILIKDGSRVITDDSFDGAADAGNIEIGVMNPGDEIILDFTVTLPGPGTGNDYQGSSIDANWTFTTESESSGGGGGGGGRRTPSNPDEPTTIIPEEPVPEGPGEIPEGTPYAVPDPDLLIIEEEPVPGGSAAKMPKTGEIPPIYFYGAGSLAVALGVAARKKKK